MWPLDRDVMSFAIEAAGWVGALLILGSYILVSSGRLTGQSRVYQWMNVVGAAGFVVNTWWHGAMPSVVLNVVWCAVGLLALWRLNRNDP
jgi:fatty acid desaturase